ncbi:MAG: hypothetical protein H5T69_11145 [Chloroflexi bacterium]|nr:hypothetical protein [Chloroflexota bacterium]
MQDSAAVEEHRIEARLHKMVRRWSEVSGYHLNPEQMVVDGIVRALERHVLLHGYPYCPCRDLSGDPQRDRVNICPCQFHHEEIRRDGHCKCVLFVGDNYDPAKAYAPEEGATAAERVRSLKSREVTLYATDWCYHSRRVQAWLEEQDIPFTKVNIDADPDAARQVEAWNDGNRSVPTLIVRLVLSEPSIAELNSLLVPMARVMRCDAHVTRWCAHSRRTLAWLARRNIAQARAVDIEADSEAAERVRRWNGGYLSVPTLDIVLQLTEPRGNDLARALGLGAKG